MVDVWSTSRTRCHQHSLCHISVEYRATRSTKISRTPQPAMTVTVPSRWFPDLQRETWKSNAMPEPMECSCTTGHRRCAASRSPQDPRISKLPVPQCATLGNTFPSRQQIVLTCLFIAIFLIINLFNLFVRICVLSHLTLESS